MTTYWSIVAYRKANICARGEEERAKSGAHECIDDFVYSRLSTAVLPFNRYYVMEVVE